MAAKKKNKKKVVEQQETFPIAPPPEEPEELGLLTKEQFERLLTRASQPRRKERDPEVD